MEYQNLEDRLDHEYTLVAVEDCDDLYTDQKKHQALPWENPKGMTISSGHVTLKKDTQNLIGISIGGGAPVCPCLYVVQVFDNTPAAKDGSLAAGDEIVGVNGQSVKGRSKVEVARLIQSVKQEVTINYNKLHADPKQGKTLDIVLKKVKHKVVENMSSNTADALGLSRAILCNDGLLKKLEEMEKTAGMYNGLIGHTKKLLKNIFELSQSHKAFGEVFTSIGVREPQPAASEAFSVFGEAHRSMEKFAIHMLKTLKPMISDLNTFLHKAVPDTRLTIKKYLDSKFEYLSYCLKVKEMDDEEYSYATLQEPLYRVETGNYEYRSFLLNIPLNVLFGAAVTLMGVLLYAYFVTVGCDPYAAGYIQNKNQMGPYFVMHVLRDLPGMTGLYMSMLFSGALSTVSSGLNSLAAITVEDVLVRPLRGAKDTTVTVVAKIAVMVFGCISVGLAYIMKDLSGPVTQLATTVVSGFGSPVLGVFVLAAGFPRCNTYGAGGGIVVGGATTLTVAIGAILYGAPTPSLPSGPVDRCDVINTSWTQPTVFHVTPVTLGDGLFNSTLRVISEDRINDFSFWDLSYLLYSNLGLCTTILSGLIISLITGYKRNQDDVDVRLIFPFCRKLYGLPEPEVSTGEEGLNRVDLKTYPDEGTTRDEEMSALQTTGMEQLDVRI